MLKNLQSGTEVQFSHCLTSNLNIFLLELRACVKSECLPIIIKEIKLILSIIKKPHLELLITFYSKNVKTFLLIGRMDNYNYIFN